MGSPRRTRGRAAAIGLLAGALLLGAAACGDDDSDDEIEFRTPTPAETATVAGQQPPGAASPTTPGTESPAATESPAGSPTGEAVTLRVESTDDDPLAFDVEELTAPAGVELTVEYANNSTQPHNIHFYQGDDADAPSIAMTEIETGPDVIERVTFTAPEEPGTYYFQCDVHPAQMNGDFVVQ